MAGRYYARLDAGSDRAIVTDAGGTTFDVSLIRRGAVPWTRETLVDRAGQLHMTGFPSVDVRSIGAGGGSIGWVDRGGLLHVGPQSAWAAPGPACWGRGGMRPTVTDACLVLGYIDPDYFLGGTLRIARAPADEAIMRDVGGPLGLGVAAAANAIFQLACERMVTAIEDITLNQGIDPRQAVLIGGGGGGLYAAAIARRLGIDHVIIPEVAAALSAAGALLSDLTQDFAVTAFVSTRQFNHELAARTIAGLAQRARSFADAADIEALRQAFHRTHEQLFAFSDPDSEVEIVAWHVNVRCGLPRRPYATGAVAPNDAASRRRPVHFVGHGHLDTLVRRTESLRAGERIEGPAIVESPLTTVVAPPDTAIERLASGSLVLQLDDSRRRH